jgi:hypothetical protein
LENYTMQKRYSDALEIVEGASDPSAIALAIADACHEARHEPNYTGNDQVTADPAIRLMVHQLAYLCRLQEIEDNVPVYSGLIDACKAVAAENRGFV